MGKPHPVADYNRARRAAAQSERNALRAASAIERVGGSMSRAADYFREIRPTLTLALPIVVGQVSQMLMGVVDSVMIGRVGTVPLAASAFAVHVFNVFYVLGIGIMIPVAIYVARARGAQRPREAAEYLRHGVALAVGVGALETLMMVGCSTQLDRFGQPAEVLEIVTPFFLLYAASLVPVFVHLALRQFAEAMGHPWAPMCIMLASVVLNAFLNWILIYGNLGAPALGLTGAGIATLIARVLLTVAMWAWLRRDPAVRAAWPSFAEATEGGPTTIETAGGESTIAEASEGAGTLARAAADGSSVRPSSAMSDGDCVARSVRNGGVARARARSWWGGFEWRRFREMLGVGVPAAGMLLFEASAFAFSGVMIGWLGSVPLAAHQIALSCASLAFMFPLGISMAAGMRVSHAVGAGEQRRLRPIAFGAVGLGLAVMAVFALSFWLGGSVIASWFVRDEIAIALAAQLLIVAAVFQLVDGTQVIGAAALRAITDVKVPTAITFVAYWVIALPLGYWLGIRGTWGVVGVWSGIASGLACAAVFLTARFAWLTRVG